LRGVVSTNSVTGRTDMYISADWLGPLEDALLKAERKHSGSISMLSDLFNDPHELVRCYVEPHCRYEDHFDNAGKSASSAFDAVNLFMGDGVDESIQGGNQMLILGNSGSGKTSLLSILRLAQVLNYRDSNLRCELLRLGLDTLDKIASISNPSETVLLLDGLDEDREAQSSARQRLLDLWEASHGFKRVFLACENRYFFQNVSDQSSGDKGGKVGDFDCPTMGLLDFDADQVERYLDTRFPKQWRQKLLKGGDREAAAKQVMNLGVLKHRPQALSLIGYLFENEGPLKDEYSLMEAVSVQWLIEENERAQKGGESHLNMESLYEFAKLLATRMTEIGQYSVSEHRVMEWLPPGTESLHLNEVRFEAYSLLQKHDFGAGERSYRFSHRTIQEFFAAQGVLDSSDEDEIVVPGYATNKMIDYIVHGRSVSDEHCDKKLIMRDVKLATFGMEAKDLKGAIIEEPDSEETYEEVDFEKLRQEGVKLSQEKANDDATETPVPGKPVSFEIEEGLYLDMLWVEPGEFNIGNRDSPVVIEIPQGFWLSKYLVTQKMYYAIMKMNPSAFRSPDKELPVEQVSWNDAQSFCEELTRLMPEGLDEPLEFRLPKESEWVHACRAGNDTNYSYGDNERVFGQHGWYSGNSNGKTHKPGEKRPNPWGFYDMHGNVWEWCYDRDDDFAHRLIIDFKQKEEDKVEVRAIRGGGWSSLVYACRIANRNWFPLHEYSNCIGFRIALVRKLSGEKKGS